MNIVMMDDLQKLRAIRTEAVEDFLKAVYLLQRQVDPVPTTLLAQSLNIAAPSVTDMIKRLSGVDDEREKKPKRDKDRSARAENHVGEESFIPLLDYTPYKGVRLNAIGERIALEVIRHHRLLELYLSQRLGYSWDEVHNEADRLEHHISEMLESRIAEALGNPEMDPHGDPIPALDGTMVAHEVTLLSELLVGQQGTVSRISDQSPDVLRYFYELGLVPGASIRVLSRGPLGDMLTLQLDDQTIHSISTQVARKVLVTFA